MLASTDFQLIANLGDRKSEERQNKTTRDGGSALAGAAARRHYPSIGVNRGKHKFKTQTKMIQHGQTGLDLTCSKLVIFSHSVCI